MLTLIWCVSSLWLGPRIGYVDQPDDLALKAHLAPTVPLGGVGIFLGVHVGLAVLDEFDPWLLLASGVVLALGLFDDRFGVSPVVRLGVEAVAAVVLVTLATEVDGVAAFLLGTALVILSINAVNLFDGLDGLVGAAGLVTALGIAWLSELRGGSGGFGALLAAALGGFLILNWHRARVFLGDNGSYVVGMLLAYGILQAAEEGTTAELITGGALLGLFVIDVIVTLLRRALNRRPLFQGDRSHLYDQVRDRGISVPGVAVIAGLLQAALVLLVLAMDRLVGDYPGVLLLSALGVVLIGLSAVGGFLRVDAR